MRTSLVLGVLSLVLSVSAEQVQVPLSASSKSSHKAAKRPLKGRFLHVTDFHPDPHYVAGGTFDSGCHRKPDKGKKKDVGPGMEDLSGHDGEDGQEVLKDKDDLAGPWGSGVSDCDSPMSLVNMTFDWLKKEWADEIDFVVWTGDNARHDIDRSLPRTPKEIFELNRMMVGKMLDTFPKGVPIVPSIGNNDIYPHNVMAAGPSSLTSEFLRIWKKFIPADAGHVFERGAYFSVEVIPDQLAVISLNTLFWYDTNTLVDGCKDRSTDPGALEMDWLEVQLSGFHERGMQVWLTGHVPPHEGTYYDNCYLRYGDLSLRYQDTIVGHLYGHMNIDHFFFFDVDDLEATHKDLKSKSTLNFPDTLSNLSIDAVTGQPLRHGNVLPSSSRMQIMGRSGNAGLVDTLKKDFDDMPGPKKIKMEDYAVINVGASVIPTYLPGLRIYTYNVSGVSRSFDEEDLDGAGAGAGAGDIADVKDDVDAGHGGLSSSSHTVRSNVGDDEEFDDADGDSDVGSEHDFEDVKKNKKKKKKKGGKGGKKHKDDCSLPENEDKPHCTFKRKPRHYSKHSPSRSNKPLSPLGYIQYYLRDVDSRSKEPPEWQIEYTTYKLDNLLPPNGTHETHRSHHPLPIPLRLLPGYDPDLFPPQGEGGDGGAGELQDAQMGRNRDGTGGASGAQAGGGGDGADKDKDEKWEKLMMELKRITPWKMKDLTIPSYVKLARKLVAEKKLWKHFADIM